MESWLSERGKEGDPEFERIELEGLFGLVRKSIPASLKEALEAPDKLLDQADIIKDSRTTRAGVFAFPETPGLFLKRNHNKGIRFTLRYLFRQARSFRALESGCRLLELGIPTPLPLAALAHRQHGILQAGYLLTEQVPSVLETIDMLRAMACDDAVKGGFVRDVSRHLATLHDHGTLHRDLKISNIYSALSKDSHTEYGIWDLDSMIHSSSPVSKDERLAELGRLLASTRVAADAHSISLDPISMIPVMAEAYKSSETDSQPSQEDLIAALHTQYRRCMKHRKSK